MCSTISRKRQIRTVIRTTFNRVSGAVRPRVTQVHARPLAPRQVLLQRLPNRVVSVSFGAAMPSSRHGASGAHRKLADRNASAYELAVRVRGQQGHDAKSRQRWIAPQRDRRDFQRRRGRLHDHRHALSGLRHRGLLPLGDARDREKGNGGYADDPQTTTFHRILRRKSGSRSLPTSCCFRRRQREDRPGAGGRSPHGHSSPLMSQKWGVHSRAVRLQ